MSEKHKPAGATRRATLLATAALVAATSGLPFEFSTIAKADESDPMFMFVHSADDLKADPGASTLRLVNVNQQVLYFSDRPERLAGHLKMADYLEEWTSKAGSDNFASDPPNATLSVYEANNDENTLAVVEISNPVIDGKDIVYTYKLLDGTMPETGGASTVFIDWIGPGGGVGFGYHGVGVGLRGPGVL